MSTVEYELTFLAAFLPPGLTGYPCADIVDVYLPSDARATVRARRLGGACEQTTKIRLDPGDAGVQREENVPLSVDEFDRLAANGHPWLHKTRYRLPVAGQTAEVDVFRGALAGLVLVEF